MFKNHLVSTLSNLQPQTVLGLEGISFVNRAMAMPGVIDVSESIFEVNTLAGEEIDVRHQIRLEADLEERMLVLPNHVIVGGLCYDQDASNPLESCDGEGKIFHRGRRANREEESNFYEALGLTSDGVPDLNAEVVSEFLADKVVKQIAGNRSLMTTLTNLLRSSRYLKSGVANWEQVFHFIRYAIQQEGFAFAPDYIAEIFFDQRWFVDLDEVWRDKLDDLVCLLSESEAEQAWSRAREAGKIGNPLAQEVDIYEHSGISYTLSGQGMLCRWDTTPAGAVWVPDACAEENIRYNVLSNLGVGIVRYFGAVGSVDDPCHARFSLDGGVTWVGEAESWNWTQATEAMIKASGRNIDQGEMLRLMQSEARNYAKSCIETYSQWANGETYGRVIYVIDRTTGLLLDEHDDETWGFIGMDHAEEDLESSLLSAALVLQRTAH